MSEHDDFAVRRPWTVTVAALLLIIPGAVGVLFTLLSTIAATFGFGGFIGGGGGARPLVLLPFMLLGLVVSLIVPVGLVLLGIGLIRMRPWAFGVSIGVSILFLVLILGPVLFGNLIAPLQIAAGAVLPLTVIGLLVAPASREALAEAREQQML